MNDKQFFNKIGLECEHSSEFCCLECEAKIDNNGCHEDCEAFQFPEITADHIIALEGLIKFPYSFEIANYIADNCLNEDSVSYGLYYNFGRTFTYISEKPTRKEALKALISWMIDENILTKEEVKAVFE